MALHHAVLALLREGPRHGYDLKGEFERLVGPQFGTMNIGHLYQLLERLARDGLAHTHREAQDARPDRVVYTLTDKGLAELDAWLDQPSRPASGFRDDFFLKLAAARRLADADLLGRIVCQRRDVLIQELRDLAALRRGSALTRYDELLTSAAELQARGQLELLDRIESAAGELVAEGRTDTTAREGAVDIWSARSRPDHPAAG